MFGYIQFPRWNELGQLIAGDDALVSLFPPSGSTKDRFVYRSVGGIGPVSPTNVAGTICEAAWLAWQQKSKVPPEPDEFVAEVCESLDRLRRAAGGNTVTMPVKVGLAGVNCLRTAARSYCRGVASDPPIELLARRRADAVGEDREISRGGAAAGESDGDGLFCLAESARVFAEVVVLGAQIGQ
jgi:hypothetical protein